MHILIATDGSDEALHALHEAARVLDKEATWSVLAVGDPGPLGSDLGYFGSEAPIIHPAIEAARSEAETDAQAACEALIQAGVAQPYHHVAVGDPASTILSECTRLGVDILVVGSHGRGWMGRLLLGSVSDSLIHSFKGAVFLSRKRP